MSENIAKLMWNAYAIRAGGKTFDDKPLPTWDELGEDRQSCWVAAASVTASRIEKLETALRNVLRYQLSDETWGLLGFGPKKIRVEFDAARKALEGKDD